MGSKAGRLRGKKYAYRSMGIDLSEMGSGASSAKPSAAAAAATTESKAAEFLVKVSVFRTTVWRRFRVQRGSGSVCSEGDKGCLSDTALRCCSKALCLSGVLALFL